MHAQATGYLQVTAGPFHTCAIQNVDDSGAGPVQCWGDNFYGQSPAPSGVSLAQVAAGENHTCGLGPLPDGKARCWGGNTWGQAPDALLRPYTQISAGDWFTCGLTGAKTIACWGRNDHDQATPPLPGAPQAPFDFAGFYPSLAPGAGELPALNAVKAFSAAPLKFSLGGDQGLTVIAPDYPASQPLDCATLDPSGALQPAKPAGGSGLSYDPASGQYTYVWKTEKAWAGKCRVPVLRLTDETEHRVAFQF
jgi:hypothetical protein